MTWEDLLLEYDEFCEYRKRENDAIEARMKATQRR